MKNTRKIFDNIEVIEPILVVKFGLVYDHYKYDQLTALWEEAVNRVMENMPLFMASDLFFQEEIMIGDIWYSFRYYTPKSNIKKMKGLH